MSRPPAILSTTHTLADTIGNTLPNAPSKLPTLPPSWLLPSTHAFSGLATILTNKSEGPGLDPSSLQPYAMLPSPSLSTPGIRSTTTSFNTQTSTLLTIDMSTTASLSTTNISFNTRLSKPSSTTISLETQLNSNRWRIFISSVSTSTSHNAPSPTCNLPNPGKSGIPQPPGASAWLYQASNQDSTPFENTHSHPPALTLLRLNSSTYMSKRGITTTPATGFWKKAPNAATCVCPNLDKGSYPTTFPQAGGQ